jgi:ankyrin repeat protein
MDIPRCIECRRTALHQAAFLGREAIVKLLLSRQAKVNLADGAGDTALDLAKQAHFPVVAEILLRAAME